MSRYIYNFEYTIILKRSPLAGCYIYIYMSFYVQNKNNNNTTTIAHYMLISSRTHSRRGGRVEGVNGAGKKL